MTEYYDKNGQRIREYDLVKVFHFTGARNKKHYMYKWVVAGERGLRFLHLDGSYDSVPLLSVTTLIDGERVWSDAEVVQTKYDPNLLTPSEEKQKCIEEEREQCIAIVESETEFPGRPPKELTDAINVAMEGNDIDFFIAAFRNAVRLTKESIKERMMSC